MIETTPSTRLRRALLKAFAIGASTSWPLATRAREPAAVAWPQIELLDGTVLTAADWAGVAAVVVFWSTTCPFCRRHNEHVEKLFRSSAGARLRVLGVALDRDRDRVRRYMAQHGHGFPVTLDAQRLQPMFSPRTVVPMTCTVDRSGRLLQSVPGEMFEEDVLELARLADQRDSAPAVR